MAIKPYLRNGVYYARGTYRGVYVYKSLETGSKRVAEDLCARLTQRILDGEITGQDKAKTFAEGVVVYWEKGGGFSAKVIGGFDEATGKWTKLVGAFADTPMSEITEDMLLEYARKAHPRAKNATINRSVIVPVKAILKANRVSAYLNIDKLKEERVETPHASPELFAATLEAYADVPGLRALILTAAATGRRLGELIDWRRAEIDWARKEIYRGRTKNGDPITVRIPDHVLDEIAELPRFGNGRVFGYSSNSSVHNIMVRRCKRAGIRYLSPHKIGRHTFATWSRKYLGKDIAWIKAAGGWRSLAAVERYIHVNATEAQVEAAGLFAAVPGGKSFANRCKNGAKKGTGSKKTAKTRACKDG